VTESRHDLMHLQLAELVSTAAPPRDPDVDDEADEEEDDDSGGG
jgi:hypothetical protein